MLRNFIAGAVVATVAWWVPTTETSSPNSRCLDGRQAALRAGGFSGPLLCEGKHASFKLAGTIKGANQRYLVYDYKYQFMPEGGSVLHGGQRVVVLSSKGKYLGQYALTPPLDVVVKETSIAISVGGDIKGVIEFKDNPPPSTLVDGERVTFFK
jgi:hypothetical protein